MKCINYCKNMQGNGKLKLASGGLGWKEGASGQVTTLPAADFVSMTWMRAMRGYQLRITLKDGAVHKFDGLPLEALAELRDFSKEHYKLDLEERELCLKGWNWGKTNIDGNHLEFLVNKDQMAFDIPLADVANATVTGKNELALEFAQPDHADKKVDTLFEIRFYIPDEAEKASDREADEEQADKLEEGEEKDAAKVLCEKIKGFSQINQASGDTIASIPEVPCIVPRGRFQLDMASTHLRLHGKSYDHRILYSSIVKLFLLPKADDTHVLFVLALDPPIRQGQTRYPFLVFQFDKDEEISVDLENMDEETNRAKYEGKLQMHNEAPTFEVISTLFRLLAGQKIIVPGTFRSQADGHSLKCALKANEGFLYPLERNFLFLPKPVTLIPHTEIAHVEFSRMGAGSGNPRSFDIKFFLKSGGQDITFSNITKEDYFPLEDFFKAKNIEFRSKDEDVRRKTKVIDAISSDEEFDEAEGKRRRLGDENESSPDEDFVEEDSDEEPDEEYDEEYESGDDEGSGRDESEDEEEDD